MNICDPETAVSHLVDLCLHLSVRVLCLGGETVVGHFLVKDVLLAELGDGPPLGDVGLHHAVQGHRLGLRAVVDGDPSNGPGPAVARVRCALQILKIPSCTAVAFQLFLRIVSEAGTGMSVWYGIQMADIDILLHASFS